VETTSHPDRPGLLARLVAGIAPREGQGVVEYGLILSLSAGLAVVLLVVFGGTLSAVLEAVGDAIDAAT
jgi:Flp pilus assembly pilin Flp